LFEGTGCFLGGIFERFVIGKIKIRVQLATRDALIIWGEMRF